MGKEIFIDLLKIKKQLIRNFHQVGCIKNEEGKYIGHTLRYQYNISL